MYVPARDDEITGLANYVEQQLGALRAALFGLAEEQARAPPCRSALSVGGILKHVHYGMQGAIARLANPEAAERTFDEATVAAYQNSLVLGENESAGELIEQFDLTRQEYLAAIRATDPAAEIVEPSMPWAGIFQPIPINVRYYLVHQVEEFARHAGHADIIREQLDGMSVPALVMTLAGTPPNAFFTPYSPAPGTLLS